MPQSCQTEMAKYVASLKASTGVRRFTSAYRAGLLTLPSSRILDAMLNTVMATLEAAKHPIASGIDKLVHKGITGQRARMFSTDDLGRASWAAVTNLKKDVGAALKGQDIFESSLKWDQATGEVTYGNIPVISPFLNFMVNGVFRVMGATDVPFTRLAFERSLREQARLRGTQLGLSGPQLSQYVEQLIPTMPDEDVARAMHDALVMTLKDKTPIAAALEGGKRAFARAGGPAAELIGDLVLPFTRIPSNVAHRTTEYTPLGVGMGAANLIRAFRLAKNADRVSEAVALQAHAVDQMARSSLGLAAIAVGYWLAEDGNVSLAYPDRDPGKQGIQQATGQPANAIRVGGNWYPVTRMAPFGPLILLGGYLHETQRTGQTTVADVATTLAAGFGATVSDQPAFTAAEELYRVKNDPMEGGTRWAQRTAASIVPGIVARAATWMDPQVREREGWLAAFQARIPGLSDELPARHDVFGQPVPTRSGFFDNMLNPFGPVPDRTAQNEFLKEMQEVGVEVTRLTQNKAAGETREQFYRRRESEGLLLRYALIAATQSPEYQDLPRVRRWAMQNVPNFPRGQGSFEEQVREDKRLFLEEVVRRTRQAVGRARNSQEGPMTQARLTPVVEGTEEEPGVIKKGFDTALEDRMAIPDTMPLPEVLP